MKKFILEYRCLGANYRLELEGESLNEVLIYFARIYSDIEKIYVAREKNFSDTFSDHEYKKK